MTLKVLHILFYSAFLNLSISFSQDVNEKDIVLKMLNGGNIDEHIDPEYRKISERLGISYTGYDKKYLIPYTQEKANKTAEDSSITFTEVELEDKFTRITINNFNKNPPDFYFYNGKLTSPLIYHTRNWQKRSSEYFNFYISDSSLINNECFKKLDDFVFETAQLLQIDKSGTDLLRNEKILYIFCKDEDEIRNITGFDTKGIYFVTEDAVATVFNTHFHEVAHLLINYKLKSLPLYTLPFLQEGFAVALGGRGGYSSSVLRSIGAELLKSDFMKIDDILTRRSFFNEDASITYPVSGAIVFNLINNAGIEEFIRIYTIFSGNAGSLDSLTTNEIRSEISFSNDFSEPSGNINSTFEEDHTDTLKIYNEKVYRTANYYGFESGYSFLLTPADVIENYNSKKFNEFFPDKKYRGEKYFLENDNGKVTLYNFYNNELIFYFDPAIHSGNYPEDIVYIDKNLFDGDLETYSFSGGN